MKTHIEIVNKTAWDTRPLRKIISRVVRQMGHTKSLYVEIGYSKRLYSGKGVLGGYSIWLRLPSPAHFKRWKALNVHSSPDPVSFAQVVWHEIQHNQSAVHRDGMVYVDAAKLTWARDIEIIERVEPKQKRIVGVVLAQKKLEHAQAMERKARSRVKRAETIAKSWGKKVSYYKKQLAKLAAQEIAQVAVVDLRQEETK